MRIFKDPVLYLGAMFCGYLWLQAGNAGVEMRLWREMGVFVGVGVDMRKPFACNEGEAVRALFMGVACVGALVLGRRFQMTKILSFVLGVACIVCGAIYDYPNTGAALIFFGGCLCLNGVD